MAWVCCPGAQGCTLPACIFFLNTLWIDCCKHKAAFSDPVEKQKCKLSAVYLLRKQSAVQWCHKRPCVHASFLLFPYLLYRIMTSLYKLCSLLHSGKMAAIPLCIKLYFSTEKKCKNGTCFLFFSCILAKLRCIIYLPTLQPSTANGDGDWDGEQCISRAQNMFYPLPVLLSCFCWLAIKRSPCALD